MRENDKLEQWLDTAVSGIRFGPDRAAVKRELREHMEDKAAGLLSVFPDMSEEEARRRALDGMGDPQELRVQLAKVHRPWLGWLWVASRWAIYGVCLAAALLNLGIQTGLENSLWGRIGGVYAQTQRGERANLGGYTFQIMGAACLDRGEGRENIVQLMVRVSSPRFWERIEPDTVYRSLTAVSWDGTRYPINGCWRKSDPEPDSSGAPPPQYTDTGAQVSRWGPTWREFAIYIPAEGWEAGDRVRLEFDSAVGSISLSAAVTERVEVT